MKPGDTVQAYIELSGNVIAAVRLEYSQNGGQRWITEQDINGNDMSYTGTQATPLTGVTTQQFIKNETGKAKVYRWRCTSYTSGSLYTYMNQQTHQAKRFHLGDDLYVVWDDDAPSVGIDGDGAGYAGKGSLYIRTGGGGGFFRNDGSLTQPNWVSV